MMPMTILCFGGQSTAAVNRPLLAHVWSASAAVGPSPPPPSAVISFTPLLREKRKGTGKKKKKKKDPNATVDVMWYLLWQHRNTSR